MHSSKIRVLVAEDAEALRLQLVRLLEGDPQIRVVGAVADGQAALEFLHRHKADVVLMDIHMPRLDGFEATRRIMESTPLPIVVCSAIANVGDTAIAFRALEAGALACVEKPSAGDGEADQARAAHLLKTVRLMSEVKVVRRRPIGAARRLPRERQPAPVRLVGMGASTGGPPVLQGILHALPKDFAAPLLVVQHMAPGFLSGMATWLAETSGLPIHIAAHGTLPLPAHVYLAPDDFHMGVGPGGRIVLSREPPENHVRPAVSFLFRSMAQHSAPGAVGVLLTGMGRDGAEELRQLKEAGAATIAQDQESSAVHGMPGAAIALGAAVQVLPAERIAEALVALVTPIR